MTAPDTQSAPAPRPPVPIPGDGFATRYAMQILTHLGVDSESRGASPPEHHPDLEWARSGAMALSGRPEGPPLPAPGPLASAARGTILALRALAGEDWLGGGLDGPGLLGERAAVFGYERRGDRSPGGSCRLLRAADGWLALNLAREDDRALLPAWLAAEDLPETGNAADAARDAVADPWSWLAPRLSSCSLVRLVDRGRMMGLPVAAAEPWTSDDSAWLRITPGREGSPMLHRRPLVLDLSSLWAGPLCAHLLLLCGARVVKLESRERPDGARRGPQRFFDLLNGGKQSVALSFGDVRDLARLRSLIERADIVVESSRPRALEALGISADDEITRRSGLSWVGITGHGRQAPERDWVAFGDDAGVAAGLAAGAGGLAAADPADSPPLFCGDAIADPLAGLHAAVAALASWQQGGSRILDVSLRDAARFAGAFPGPVERARVERRGEGWLCRVGALAEEVALPRAREVSSVAPELGHDNERVFDELGIA